MPRSHKVLNRCLALVVAVNYAAFRVELFEDEYQSSHPSRSTAPAVSATTLNWETFDKDNAPQAIVVTAAITTICLLTVSDTFNVQPSAFLPFKLIRDKSPPTPVITLA